MGTVRRLSSQASIRHCVDCINSVQALVANSFTLTHMKIVFLIYLNNGVTRSELAEETGLAQSTVNRYVQDLTTMSWTRGAKESRPAGHDLITEKADEHNLRVKHIYLNDRGRELIKAVVHNMQGIVEENERENI